MNSAVVYKLIDQQGPISRIQISELSQLAPASVTKITRHLLARGLIKEVGATGIYWWTSCHFNCGGT